MLHRGQIYSEASEGGGGGGPTPPPVAGYTSWLYLDDTDTGAFPTVANTGSLGGNWTQGGANIVVADSSGPPSGMKYALNPVLAAEDYLSIGASTHDDFFNASAGMYGLIFRWVLTYSDTVNNSPKILGTGGGSTQFGIAHHASLGWIRPYIDNSSCNLSGYTSDTWRVLVAYWDGTKLSAKLNGGSWTNNGDGTIDTMTTPLLLLHAPNASTNDSYAAEFVTYDAGNEANGDLLMNYLIGRAGL